VHFVGLDLAWGENAPSGIAAMTADGRLLHVGVAQDDDEIAAALAPFIEGDCIVAIDAPLIVPNETGSRQCEKDLNADFQGFEADARPAFSDKPEFKNPRGARLANALGLDMDPTSSSGRRAIEVSPPPATVVLFGLEKTLKYKRGEFAQRHRELVKLMTHIEELDKATPRLRVNRSINWVALRRRVDAASRPNELDGAEDPVDAVICAYVALYWYDRPEDVTIYGDVASGYIVTPSLPEVSAPVPRSAAPKPKRDRDLMVRLVNAEAKLASLAAELEDIRRHLDARQGAS
jgi:predicted RNase H-like nuclease